MSNTQDVIPLSCFLRCPNCSEASQFEGQQQERHSRNFLDWLWKLMPVSASSGYTMSLQHANWQVDDWSEEPRNIREKALAARAWQNERPALVGKPVCLAVYAAAAAVDSSLWILKTSWIQVYQYFQLWIWNLKYSRQIKASHSIFLSLCLTFWDNRLVPICVFIHPSIWHWHTQTLQIRFWCHRGNDAYHHFSPLYSKLGKKYMVECFKLAPTCFVSKSKKRSLFVNLQSCIETYLA